MLIASVYQGGINSLENRLYPARTCELQAFRQESALALVWVWETVMASGSALVWETVMASGLAMGFV